MDHPTPQHCQRPEKGGFSLIEVILALGVISFAAIPMIALLGNAMAVNRDAMEISLQERIFQSCREKISSAPPDSGETLYFNISGAELPGREGAIYQVRVDEVQHLDATVGLVGRRSYRASLERVDMPSSNPVARVFEQDFNQ